ncbi:hypothetical protein PLESTB_000648500 [Pleodorina starrii]|uniref:Protein kinase domain-containing protein n=1 Tax=Pleodorina starrii TaxID=330485 RepID=A0A9W6F1W5_9CHLO|nr:hypothetical protein PLESTB_000648500 [Pleodorina starrii]
MRSSALFPRAPCRERLSTLRANVCALCKRHVRAAVSAPRPARRGRGASRSARKAGFQVQSCAVAAPERHVALYRSELGYRTDFAAQYSLLEIIGKGNFGTVWLAASREEPSHQVAVKVVPKSREDRSHEESLECIRREVAMWGSLSGDSRYVAELLGLYEDVHNVYLVQQLCQGGDLSEALKDGPLPEACCAAVMWCVLSAIRDCHDHRLALMDVKPQNFLLTAAATGVAEGPSSSSGGGVRHLRLEDQVAGGSACPCVVACDFGCSLSYTELMRGAKRAGSPVFFAPEQFTSSYGLVVDEWAAGVMLYLLLSGRYPFWDCKRDELDKTLPAYQVMLAVCSAPIAFGGPEWRGISREARDLVSQLLDRNPATRLTADAALEHPWFARWMTAPRPPSPEAGNGNVAATKDAARTTKKSPRRGRASSDSPAAAAPPPEDSAAGCCCGTPVQSAALGFGGPTLSPCCGASNIVPLPSHAPVRATTPSAGQAATSASVAAMDVAGSDDEDAPSCSVDFL